MAQRSAFATLFTSASYEPGVRGIACALHAVHTHFPLLLIATPELYHTAHQLSHDWKRYLEVKAHELRPLRNPYTGRGQSRFAGYYVMTKLRMWSLTEYEQLVYLDADMLLIGNIDHLFSLEVEFAAAPAQSGTSTDSVRWGRFNTGLMMLRPSQAMHSQMLAALGMLDNEDGSDQGFLQAFFRDRVWTSLPSKYNWSKRRELGTGFKHSEHWFQTVQNDTLVFHLVGPKPWQGKHQSQADDPDIGGYPHTHGLWWRSSSACPLPSWKPSICARVVCSKLNCTRVNCTR